MNHGVIENITLPAGFKPVELPEEERMHHYLEYRVQGTTARICYEDTDMALAEEDRQSLQRLFDEKLSESKMSRRLDLTYKPDGSESNPTDLAAYWALCQSFVFGGRLVRGGACVDEEKSSWEVRKVSTASGATNVVVGNLQFHGPDGRPVKNRQARVVMPVQPGDGGNGYLWLEGTEQELKQFGPSFFDSVIAQGKFRQLSAALR
jgi:hypothetical protein